jgi:hypothetical protein
MTQDAAETATPPAPPAPGSRWLRGTSDAGLIGDRGRLVLLSFLMLFIELALIRWLGSNVIYLSYFSNFVLLGAFLGIGIGFLRAKATRDLSGWAPVALGLLVLIVKVFPVTISAHTGDVFTFSTLTPKGPPREVVLAFVFVMSATVMALVTEGLARTFGRFQPLDAYKYDLLGSIAGIVGFSLLSFLQLPPLAWGIVAALGFIALWLPRLPGFAQLAALVVLIVVLAIESFTPGLSWSPYYKISAIRNPNLGNQYQIDVNGVPHQAHQSAENAPGKGLYDVVKDDHLDNVLVIGAGGGNDVSVALRHGAKHVDAVEIDPRLLELGKESHPDHPYSDPRVSTHVTDGRAFLQQTKKRYDLIILALPDSITLLSGQSSLRLESYLFTKQAFETARDRLAPNGIFAMYNFYEQTWLLDRYGSMLESVYGKAPCFQTMMPALGEGGVPLDAFIAGGSSATVHCTAAGRAHVWKASGPVPAAATDDHPFPYLKNRSLPTLYIVSLLMVILVSLVAVRTVGGPYKQMRPYLDLFFMGAAFLLLETKNVVQFALLFGTTWFVNALVFAGVLASVLVAIAVSRRVSFKHPVRLYAFLALSLVVAYVFPASALLDLPTIPRFLAAVALAFTPIFTANLVFTQRFKDTESSTAAFGANLLGSIMGGVLEYLALITGYRALIFAVAILYGLAFLLGRKHLTPAAASA